MTAHVLVVRLDNHGDVLLTGPAIRAVAAGAGGVTLLAGPRGAAAGRMLPGVDEVLVFRAPWIDQDAGAVNARETFELIDEVTRRHIDRALIFTSFHQSALPTALLLRLAGVPEIAAISEDFPGSLLDLRHHVPDDIHEVERALSLADAFGYPLPSWDTKALAVRRRLPSRWTAPWRRYVAVHPGASVPARAWEPHRHAAVVSRLVRAGHPVVVTGTNEERPLTALVAGSSTGRVLDLGGMGGFEHLADVLARASLLVTANTGPAHLAAAVGTPVVSIFAPTVPAVRWRPWGVPCVLLGDQSISCAGCRARECPVPGHPCIGQVTEDHVLDAVERLIGRKWENAFRRRSGRSTTRREGVEPPSLQP